MTMRGNLSEGGREGKEHEQPPKGEKLLKGGEVLVTDSALRSKAEDAGTPGKHTSQVGKFVGKTFTGKRRGRGKSRWTAAAAAAVLGKR